MCTLEPPSQGVRAVRQVHLIAPTTGSRHTAASQTTLASSGGDGRLHAAEQLTIKDGSSVTRLPRTVLTPRETPLPCSAWTDAVTIQTGLLSLADRVPLLRRKSFTQNQLMPDQAFFFMMLTAQT